MSELKFTEQDKIGSIVVVFPGASNILKKYGIDFCCGGGRPLAKAIEEKSLDQEQVLRELNEAYEAAVLRTQDNNRDWRQAPMSELIDHIVQKHHGFLNQELPVISEFVTKVLRVHGVHHGNLAGLHRAFHALKTELEQHLISEETVMFPLVCEYEKNEDPLALRRAQEAINELESEHTGAGDLLKEMRELTENYTLPADACRTYTLAFQKLEALESDLFEHIHLENNILFPRVLNGTV